MLTGFLVLMAITVVVIAFHDLLQRRHSLLRNFPVIGHGRYLIELLGPELRQYIVASDTEERPFSRDQRRWVYASSKGELNTFGFGSDREMEQVNGYLVIKPAPFPAPPPAAGQRGGAPLYEIPCAKVLGAARGRRHAFRPRSVVNISGMSFGALSGAAVEAMNRGAAIAGCLHNVGEGGISPYHRHGGDLIFQIGTGYFGCRDEQGRFSIDQLKQTIADAPVRAIEIKLSQGAKPGLGGHLPGPKVTPEIAAIRQVPVREDCISPPAHTAFSDTDLLLDFVELVASETGLPVGIKAAVGDSWFWEQLAEKMTDGSRGVDFVTVDGGEGGTGAAPLAFTNHVALPFKIGFARVCSAFARRGIADRVVFIGSGKLGFPEAALFAFALGCDMINVGREAMLSVGCIQAQKCHTGHCPVGVATQSKWLMRGLDPTLKANRCANYLIALRAELLSLTRSCGEQHPALVGPDHLEVVAEHFQSRDVADTFGYERIWTRIPHRRRREIQALMEVAADKDFGDHGGGPIAGDGTASAVRGHHLPNPF